MADFKKAFSLLEQNEGGYANDPSDEGGETYRGIARRYNPSWPGWAVIDREKTLRNVLTIKELSTAFDAIPDLQAAILEFYRAKYWDSILGDEIPDDNLASLVMDCAVNHGPGDAVRWLQQGLNALNLNGKLYADMLTDGRMTGAAIQAIGRLIEYGENVNDLIVAISGLRIAYYVELMKQKPAREVFARGWLRRAAKFISLLEIGAS